MLWQAASEYCRIVGDLFPDDALVRFGVTHPVPRMITAWEPVRCSKVAHHAARGCATHRATSAALGDGTPTPARSRTACADSVDSVDSADGA